MWDFCIRRPVFTTVLMSTLVLFGVLGYQRMGIDLFPKVEPPIVAIVCVLPGANPDIMDQQVADVIEEEVSTLEGIDTIRSTSLEGFCQIIIEFNYHRDIDVAAQEVRDRVAAATRNLPQDLEAPLIQKVDPSAQPIMWLAVSGNGPPNDLSRIVEDEVKARIQSLPGVGGIQLGGFRRRAIRVWLDPVKLRAREVSPLEVLAGIRIRHVELPGGRLETELQETTIKVEGQFETIDELGTLIVAYRNGAPVRLSDLGRIEDGQEDLRNVTRFNGSPTIGLGIRKQSGGNTVAVARAVRAVLPDIRKSLPDWVSVQVAFDSSEFIQASVDGVRFDLVFGALFTALVMFLFLRHLNSTFIAVVAIPASLISTFGFTWMLGFTINQMSMLGMSLAVGLVIDDAIVVLENIFRHVEHGEDAMTAAKTGTREVAFAVIAATVSIAAIFIPVAFMGGIIGQFFREFGLTVAITILLSLLVSLTLTPMLSSRMLHKEEHENVVSRAIGAFLDGLDSAYRAVLGRFMATSFMRFMVLVSATIIFLASLGLFPFIGKEFASPQDMGRFLVFFETAMGSSVENTAKRGEALEKIVAQHPEIRGALVIVGQSNEVHKGLFFVNLTSRRDRPMSQQQVMNTLRREMNEVPGVTAIPSEMNPINSGAQRDADIQYVLQGPDVKTLDRISTEILTAASAKPFLVDLDSDLDLTRPQLTVRMDRSALADVGIDELSVTTALQVMMGGHNAAKFKSGGDRYDIRVKAEGSARKEVSSVRQIPLHGPRGQLIDLGSLVDLKEDLGPNAINRYNRQRSAMVMANVEGMAKGDAGDQFLAIAEKIVAKYPGYTIQAAGQTKVFNESNQYLLFALLMSIVIVYLVLAAQFESFIHPFTIMLTLPLALVGVLVGLFATGKTLSIFAFIGVIMLVGIVTRNAILLVDLTNQMREKGMERVAAVCEAAPVRLRPILMTAIAAIVGILPVALGMSEGGEARAPMGVTVIGGLISSTFLTLFVIPAVYLTMEDLLDLVKRAFKRGAKA